MDGALIAGIVIALVAVFIVLRAVRIVPQARAGNVERLGRYYRTLGPGLNFVIPFIDRVRPLIDLREQVVSFKPQPVITEDNLVVDIDTVLYFQVTDPRAAAYEIANFIQGVEQLTVTTLRNVVGGMDLEKTLTSRDTINSQLRGVLDEATGKWGIRVNRVEIKAIDPPKTIKEAMEKQMRAERDKRAAILTAEGQRQSKILTAEGEKQSAILRAEGERTAQILKAEGQSQAIDEVFQAVHRNDPDPQLLAYQYLQMLPQLANGPGNTFWVIPSEVTSALQGVSKAFSEALPTSPAAREHAERFAGERQRAAGASEAVAEAQRAAEEAKATADDSEMGPRRLAGGGRQLGAIEGAPNTAPNATPNTVPNAIPDAAASGAEHHEPPTESSGATEVTDPLGGLDERQDPATVTRSTNRP